MPVKKMSNEDLERQGLEWLFNNRIELPIPPEKTRWVAGQIAALQEALFASERLRTYAYVAWTSAGGPDECRHRVAAGLHCPDCDLELVERTIHEHGQGK